jgi:acyl CoA:acetate/3-ketoacid CoA transferase alpha subunit
MEILSAGTGELIGWHDPDEQRQWISDNKPRKLADKRLTVAEAIAKYVRDGDFIVVGGFGHVRVPMALLYEVVRQGKRDLVLGGKTAVHDGDILIGSGCVSRIEVAYAFGHELRGLSPASRRAVETGSCRVVAEISNAGYQWRFLAGSLGIPFIPARSMLGTDTLRLSSSKVALDPWTKKPVCLVPAAYPDVAMFHVPRCDKYGNAQIDGILVEDFEIARAARRVLVTTEALIDNETVRNQPWHTVIPAYVVDAVCEVPYGAHPTQMPYLYFFDEEHIALWLELSKTPQGTRSYFDEFVHGTRDFNEYLNKIGGSRKLEHLMQVERLEIPMEAPWLKSKR